MESKDYLGQNMLSIISRSELYKLLDTKIMDRIVHEKWDGISNETHSIVTYSTGHHVVHDIFEQYVGANWFSAVIKRACEWDHSEHSHVFKLFIWKKSMLLRTNIEFIIIILYSLLFLELIIVFVGDLHVAEYEARALLEIRTGYYEQHGYPEHKAYLAEDGHGDSHDSPGDGGHRRRSLVENVVGGVGRMLAGGGATQYDAGHAAEYTYAVGEDYHTEEYEDREHHLHEDLVHALHEVDYILALSCLHLVAPFTIAARYFYVWKTKRTWVPDPVILTVEGFLVFLVVIWIYDRVHYTHWDEHNQFMESDQTYSPGELFMLTVIWHIKANESNFIDGALPLVRFDVILALTAFATLLKLFLQFEFTPTFGPLYKMLMRMLKELVRFLCIWVIQLTSFAAVAVLAFGSLPTFADFNSSIIYFIEASLGEFDITAFEGPSESMTNIGKYFLVVFLIINLILMLNLVIAILSDAFAQLSQYTNGLYCDTLIKNFAHLEWDDDYGSLAVAFTPFQVTYLLSVPMVAFVYDNDTLRWRNDAITRFLFWPVAVAITVVFAACNIAICPLAYAAHAWTMFTNICNAEHSAKHQCWVFLSFLAFGLPTLVMTTFIDVPVFAYNLYTQPLEDVINSRQAVLESFERETFIEFKKSLEVKIYEIKQEVRELRQKTKEKGATLHLLRLDGHFITPYADFNARLQEDFKIVEHVAGILFGGGQGIPMFITNEYTRKQQLNPKLLTKLKQFTLLKMVMQNCSNEQGILDLTLMKQFADQILMHEKLYDIIAKYKAPVADYQFSKLIHAFLVLRPTEIIFFQSSKSETLETMTKRIINLDKWNELQDVHMHSIEETAEAMKTRMEKKRKGD
jgi:hypothetical protein